MQQCDSVTLISEINEDDTEEIEVYAEIGSIRQNEFYAADQAGMRPEFVAVVWADEYDDETIIEYCDKKYEIYRTYERNDGKIELYCQSRAGV